MKKSVSGGKDESVDRSLAAYDVNNSTTLKIDSYNKQVNSKLKLQNESVTYELTGKPADYNTTDLALNLKHVSKYTPRSG